MLNIVNSYINTGDISVTVGALIFALVIVIAGKRN